MNNIICVIYIMGNPVWTIEEETAFCRDMSNKIDIKELSKKYSRSVTALELRLKKIIYNNIDSNMTKAKNNKIDVQIDKFISPLSKTLKMSEEIITQYYYEYKGYLENKEKNILKNYNSVDKIIQSNNKNTDIKENNIVTSSSKEIKKEIEINKKDRNKLSATDKMNRIQKENKIMKEIIDNIELKKNINKMIKNDILDKNIKKIIRKISSNNKKN